MDDNSDILQLIQKGQNEALEKIIAENPGVAEQKTGQGISLLQFACYCRNSEAVSILKKRQKKLSLFEAASIGDSDTVKTEIAGNEKLINSFSADGFTALGLASFFGNTNIVHFLLANGANPDLASKNDFHVSPIHSACAISNYDIVEILIKSGANVNARQMQGVTPLHSAAHNGQTKIAKLLIESGADINAKTDKGQTPLSMALEKDFKETADLLKDSGGH